MFFLYCIIIIEIARVRFSVFRYDLYTDSLKLPEPKGGMVQLMEKVYIPKKDHPDVYYLVLISLFIQINFSIILLDVFLGLGE